MGNVRGCEGSVGSTKYEESVNHGRGGEGYIDCRGGVKDMWIVGESVKDLCVMREIVKNI